MNGTDHDAEILRLFRQWVAGRRALDQIGRQHPEKDCTDIPEWNALDADIAALEHRLADIPAGGASGLAVKAYLAAYHEHWGSDEDAAALCGIYRESFGDNPEQHPCAHLECALLRDAGRLVPEIAPLVVRVTQDRAEPGNAAEGEAASDEEGGEAEAEIGFGPYPCPAGPEPPWRSRRRQTRRSRRSSSGATS